jgi:hypothetical protein
MRPYFLHIGGVDEGDSEGGPMALQELVIVNPARKTTKRRRTNKRKVNNMARRKVSRRSTTARRKAPARRTTTRRKTTTRRRKAPARRTTTRRKAAPKRRTTTRRKTTTRRRKAPARRTTTRRKTTTRRRKSPARRRSTRRKTTTRRRKSPARRRSTRRKTTTRRRKSPARRKSTRRKTTGRRRRTTSRRKTASRRRSVSRKMSIKGAMNWTRSNLMKFEMMAALAGGIAVSAALPGLAQRALSKVGLNFDLTSGYRATVSSLALAGLGGYALYSIANVSAQTAGLFTVAAMVPAALGALSNLGLPVPSIHVSGGPLASGTAGLFGLLGNPSSVIDEPLFGGYHDGMHAGMHAGVHGEMFGLGGKDINLF